jgi:hypothetical protein
VNTAVTAVFHHLACRVCEVFSRHNMTIDGCKDSTIFNPHEDIILPAKVKPLRTNKMNAAECAQIHDAALKELALHDSSSLAPYNPPLTGSALYFTRKSCQIRAVPTFGSNESKVDPVCKKKSYTKDAEACKRSNADMIFPTLCLAHYQPIGFSRVFKKEGRKDVFECLSGWKLTPAAVFVYDTACS